MIYWIKQNQHNFEDLLEVSGTHNSDIKIDKKLEVVQVPTNKTNWL